MSEQRPPDPAHGEAVGMDREIQVRTFAWFGVALVAMTLVALFAMSVMFNYLNRRAQSLDPDPSPLQEANERRPPPTPNLQVRPEVDLATLRAKETARLHGYGWVDQSQGIAHIPIERAIEIVAQRANAPVDVAPAPGTTEAVPQPAPEVH
jgi:hypothetical protein